MFTVNHEETIERPVEEVFAFIADVENEPHWCPPVLESSQVEGDGPQKGAVYRQIVKPGPKKLTNKVEITEYEAGERMAWQGSNEMADFHGWYEVEPVNDGTRVVMSSSLAAKGLMRLLEPFIRRAAEGVTEEEFQTLKRLLENGEADAG
jgi:uncharacterized membrane protein